MRALALILLPACWGPPPCTPEECAASCPEVAGVGSFGDGLPGGVLTKFETEQLAGELARLREGLVVEAASAAVCLGVTGCDTRRVGDLPTLGAGTWHVEVPFRMPPVMAADEVVVSYAQRCEVSVSEGNQVFTRDDLKRSGQIGVTADARGRGAYVGPPIESPATDGDRLCAWRVTMETKDGKTSEAEGRFGVPSVATLEQTPTVGADGTVGDGVQVVRPAPSVPDASGQ